MLKRFVFIEENQPEDAWLDRFNAGRKEAERWYFGANHTDPPTAAECRSALRKHMPELVGQYDRVCALVGDDEIAHRILSHFRPPPVVAGCSQAIWLKDGGPALIRNYDFPLNTVSNQFQSTSWFGREVISKAQRPWGGCTDGMNSDGLVASLTFVENGIRDAPGFSVILMLRYVLETCRQVSEAIAALKRIPIAMSHNITLLDRSGAHATLFLGPNRKPAVTKELACANHQETVSPIANSGIRQQTMFEALNDPKMSLSKLSALFLEPPLYFRSAAFPTAYTAIYLPAEGRVDYIWPGECRAQHTGRFNSGEYVHDYGELTH